MTTPTGTFGAVLRGYRVAAGLTQEELAERAGLSPRGLVYLEAGTRRPYRETVRRLAEALALLPHQRAVFEQAARGTPHLQSRSPDLQQAGVNIAGPRLVGRLRELTLLEQHLRGEGPPLLLIGGEPGIGKSRLLQETMARATVEGLPVLSGDCQRRSGHDPYAPLPDALSRYLACQPASQVQDHLRGCAWLVRLLPELAAAPIDRLPDWPLAPEQERRLMFEAVARFLTQVAGVGGALVVLDDLHWAGADALDLLVSLIQSPASRQIRFVGAYRTTDVRPQDPLAVALADLASARLITRHVLGRLAPHEALQLLVAQLDGQDGTDQPAATQLQEQVARRTGGVPFFLLSCAEALRTSTPSDRLAAAEMVPWDVRAQVRQRVAALPLAAREMLGLAAVIGRDVPLPLLLAVTTQPEPELVAVLQAACTARLLEEDGDGYRFVHDVIREVIEGDLGTAGRRFLHRHVAETLEQELGVPAAGHDATQGLEALAYHYARSTAQEKAALYLERSGDKAAGEYASAAAEAYYREALERLDRLGRPVAAAQVREKLGAVLAALARYDAALAVFEQAAQTYQAADELEGLRRVLAQIAEVHMTRAAPVEGLERLQPLLPLVETSEPSAGLAALYVALARIFSLDGRYGESVAAAEHAAALARAVLDVRILAAAEEVRGQSLLLLGRVDGALDVLAEAIRLAEVATDGEILAPLMNAAAIHDDRGEFEISCEYAERAVAVAERLGYPEAIASTLALRGFIAFHRGNWVQARADGERALTMSHEIGPSNGFIFPRVWLGQLRVAEGAWEEAAGYLEEAAALTGRSRQLRKLRWAQGTLADLDVRAGRAGAAITRLAPLLDRPGLQEHDVTMFLHVLAEAHLLKGNVAEADRVVTQAVARARAGQLRRALVEGLRVQALVALRQERWAGAASRLEEGLALARDIQSPYAEARLLHVSGLMQAEQGEAQAARECLTGARTLFQRLGARWDVRQVERALGRA